MPCDVCMCVWVCVVVVVVVVQPRMCWTDETLKAHASEEEQMPPLSQLACVA